MRILISIVAVLLVVAGAAWFLQGVGVLPGSFMMGHLEWAIYGAVAVLAGLLLLIVTNRRR